MKTKRSKKTETFTKPDPTKMWAVIGTWHIPPQDAFFYVGAEYTRKAAIRNHIGDKGQTWRECTAMGDRVIKVLVIPL